MTATSSSLRELGEFLRSRRSELTPQEVGLPSFDYRQRRVRGLRREEVAQLAAISTDYYTRIEQGRLRPSDSVLAALSWVLKLDVAQSEYVTKLIARSGMPSTRRRTRQPVVRPQLLGLLQQLPQTPALVLGPFLDVLAWNDLAAALLVDFDKIPPGRRNYVRLMFTDSTMRTIFTDWESVAQTCVAILRMVAASNPGDPRLAALVGDLSIADPDFRRMWAEHRVMTQDFGRKTLDHPIVGELTLDWDSFYYAGDPEQQLVLWSAEPGSTSQEALRALADHVAEKDGDLALLTSSRAH